MLQVEKEDRIIVLKDLLGENCPEFKFIPTTDIEINLECLFITKIPHDGLLVFHPI
jgi:hypothetical protein